MVNVAQFPINLSLIQINASKDKNNVLQEFIYLRKNSINEKRNK